MITLASIVSPLVGGYLADAFGFNATFSLLGIVLTAGGIFAWLHVNDDMGKKKTAVARRIQKKRRPSPGVLTNAVLFPAYLTAFTTTLGQGMLMYEIPYVMAQSGQSTTATGFLLTMMGLGSLLTLTQKWLNRYSPYNRCFLGLAGIAAVFYAFAIELPVPPALLLFLKGAAHGLLFPAKTTILTGGADTDDYGKAFGIHSAVMSSGHVIGPAVTGIVRNIVSPFFFAFILTMVMILLFIFTTAKVHIAPVAWRVKY